MNLKIAAPRMRLNFCSEHLPLSALSDIIKAVAVALEETKLVDRAAECTVANEGRRIYLLDPAGIQVWSRELVLAG